MKHLLLLPYPFFPELQKGQGMTRCGEVMSMEDINLVNEDRCEVRGITADYDCPACKADVEEGKRHVELVFARDAERQKQKRSNP